MAKTGGAANPIATGRVVMPSAKGRAATSGSAATAGSSEAFSRGATAIAKSMAMRPLLAVDYGDVIGREGRRTAASREGAERVTEDSSLVWSRYLNAVWSTGSSRSSSASRGRRHAHFSLRR